MKKSIKIKYQDGTESSHIAYPPDFTRWELHTKKSLSDFAGMHDILWVAHSAMKREAAGKPVKPFDVWIESIIEIDVDNDTPKAMSEEA